MRIVICGAGAIGAATAYYAACAGADVVVERQGVACAASGKSDGFLARDWCEGSALAPLARRSFDLHGELAGSGLGEWHYRRLDTWGLSPVASGTWRAIALPKSLSGFRPALPRMAGWGIRRAPPRSIRPSSPEA